MDTLEQPSIPIIEQLKSPSLKIVPTPNDPPWNSWAAIGLWVFSVLMIMFVPAIFLVPYLVSSGVLKEGGERIAEFSISDPTAVVLQMLGVIPAHIFTLVVAWMIVTRFRKYSFSEMLGFKSGGVRWWPYVIILIGFFALAAVVSQFFPEAENQLTRILQSSRTAVFVVAFMATFTAPLVEEVVYRGVAYSAFQRSFGTASAVIIVTLLFTSVHVPQYYESPSTILLLAILSLILTLMRVFSGNLLPCVIFHTLINGVQSVGLIAEPYLKQYFPADAAAIFLSLK
ncbi:MAG: lysostaphin resistance A-like protein [Pyrinomonadaceae bacterium]